MHPDIHSSRPGTCSKCGMRLVLNKNNTQHKQTHATEHMRPEKTTLNDYKPLIVIIGLITLTTLTLSLRDYQQNIFTIEKLISYFMTGFFITFAGFKLIDLKGFAEGYYTYDLLAKRWLTYGYIYPFIELFFGLSMILGLWPYFILWAEVIVMTFSGIGVALKLARGEKFQCACLGTFLKVPLTKITLIEDFAMAALAGTLLYI
jgi:hypothetical protein